jgi:hypothetical protein
VSSMIPVVAHNDEVLRLGCGFPMFGPSILSICGVQVLMERIRVAHFHPAILRVSCERTQRSEHAGLC